MDQRKPMSFLSLPYEVRSRVYRYYLPTTQNVSNAALQRSDQNSLLDLAILRVCRQIFTEAREVFFRQRTLTLNASRKNGMQKLLASVQRWAQDRDIKKGTPRALVGSLPPNISTPTMPYDNQYAMSFEDLLRFANVSLRISDNKLDDLLYLLSGMEALAEARRDQSLGANPAGDSPGQTDFSNWKLDITISFPEVLQLVEDSYLIDKDERTKLIIRGIRKLGVESEDRINRSLSFKFKGRDGYTLVKSKERQNFRLVVIAMRNEATRGFLAVIKALERLATSTGIKTTLLINTLDLGDGEEGLFDWQNYILETFYKEVLGEYLPNPRVIREQLMRQMGPATPGWYEEGCPTPIWRPRPELVVSEAHILAVEPTAYIFESKRKRRDLWREKWEGGGGSTGGKEVVLGVLCCPLMLPLWLIACRCGFKNPWD